MADLRKMPKSFVLEFIELYRKCPCLWNLRSKKYFDRNLKKSAYELLKNKLREVIPNATRQTVIRKIDSIRGSFRTELKKVRESEQSESGANGIYKPRLWYFEKLLFLKERGRKRSKKKDEEPSEEPEEPEVLEITANDDYSNQIASGTCTPGSTISSIRSGQKNHKKRKLGVSDHLLRTCEKLLSEEIEDDFDIIGKNIANKLRRLSKETQLATITEKLITDIMYQASIGNVNQHSTIIINNSVNATAGTIVLEGSSITLKESK